MPIPDKDLRYAHEMKQHKATDFLNEPRTARGRWLEISIVIVVLAVVAGIGIRLISKFVGEAKRTSLDATAYSVLVSARCAAISDAPDDKEWKAFCNKYSEWQSVAEFSKGDTDLEKSIGETLETSQSSKLYVRLTFDGREIIDAEVTRDPEKETGNVK